MQVDHIADFHAGHGVEFNVGVTLGIGPDGLNDLRIKWASEIRNGPVYHRVYWAEAVPWWRRWLLRLVLGMRWTRIRPCSGERWVQP